MLFAFANEVEEGDAVICSDRARRQVVIGRITGPYEWVEDPPANQQHHTRKIEWSARWGWDDLPETVRNTVLHYQRTVLEVPGSGERADAGREGRGLRTARRLHRARRGSRPRRRSTSDSRARAATNGCAPRASSSGRARSSAKTPRPAGSASSASESAYPGSPANGLSRHASPRVAALLQHLRRGIRQQVAVRGSRRGRRVGRPARVTRTPRAGS